jgi:streptogramin lyase
MVKDGGRKIATVVIAVLLIYMILGIFGVLPNNLDIAKKFTSTELKYSDTDNGIHHINITKETLNVVVDSSGNAWYLETVDSGRASLYKVLKNGNYQDYPLPFTDLNTNFQKIEIFSNHIFIPIYQNDVTHDGFIGFNLKTETFDIEATVLDIGAYPKSLAFDNNDNVWLTEDTGKLASISVDLQTFHEYTIPYVATNTFFDIKVDTNGNVWFTEVTTEYIGIFYPSNTSFSRIVIPNAHVINIAPHGDYMWCADTASNSIYKIDINTYVVTKISISYSQFQPRAITVDNSNGNVWVTESQGYGIESNYIGQYTPSGDFKLYEIYTGAVSTSIVVDSGHNVWFTESNVGKIGYIDAVITGNVDFKILSINDWTSDKIYKPSEYVNVPLVVRVEITSEDAIASAQILYKNVGQSDYEAVDLTISSGDSTIGIWNGTIPSQTQSGNLEFYVDTFSDMGNESVSASTTVLIKDITSSNGTIFGVDSRYLIYGMGIAILLPIGMAINRRKE